MSNQVKTRSKKKNKAKAHCASKGSQANPKAQKQEVAEERVNASESKIQSSVKSDPDQEKHVKTIEIRDKRINIVFKTIYVFAIFFAAVFVELGRQLQVGLTSVYAAECCVAAFLLTVIVYMVLYIISEMKCLKIHSSNITEKEIKNAEESYTRIIEVVTKSGAWSLVLLFLCILLVQYFSEVVLLIVFVVCVFAAVIPLQLSHTKSSRKWLYTLGVCSAVTALTCFFCMLPLNA